MATKSIKDEIAYILWDRIKLTYEDYCYCEGNCECQGTIAGVYEAQYAIEALLAKHGFNLDKEA